MSSLKYDIFAIYVIFHWWHMTLLTYANMGVYGTFKAHGFKVVRKLINMPKKQKNKKPKFPLYFSDFSFINWSRLRDHLEKSDWAQTFLGV